MLEDVGLRQDICQFIAKVGTVEPMQIERMFREYSPDSVKHHIKKMLFDKQIMVDNTGKISYAGRSTVTPEYQRWITFAAWVVAEMGARKVRTFYITEYPFQLLIFTNDNQVFDVAVFFPLSVDETAQGAKRVLASSMEPSIPDAIQHIAMVSHKELIVKLHRYGIFDFYSFLDSDNKLHIVQTKQGGEPPDNE